MSVCEQCHLVATNDRPLLTIMLERRGQRTGPFFIHRTCLDEVSPRMPGTLIHVKEPNA